MRIHVIDTNYFRLRALLEAVVTGRAADEWRGLGLK